jgi:phosphoglycolate phosphatase-like HAD superfamily hydrolase
MIKNIFFDFDGVLAESVNVKTQAFKTMYLPFGEEFANQVVAHHLANGGMSRFEKFKLYHERWLHIEVTDFLLEELTQEFSNLVLKSVVASIEVNGAIEFLENYKGQFKYWIITGTPTDEILNIVEQRGIKKYFEEVCGSPIKKDVWANKIIQNNGLLNKETVFVGDALADYNAAIHCNLHFVLRETDDNVQLFKGYQGLRIKDMTELYGSIRKLNT